jgi:DNA invertase Pin-like site-specific DNA recombinase
MSRNSSKYLCPINPLYGRIPDMNVGYARVSTGDQNFNLQRDALKAAGCDESKIFTDRLSGGRDERPGLVQALEYVRQGDTLVVWRLDRLGRSLSHLIQVTTGLEQRGVGFKSLQEGIDTTTSGGKLVFHIFGALAEFERSLIRERTNAGLKAARARGRNGGRRKKLDFRKLAVAESLLKDSKLTVAEVAEQVGIARSTLYTYLERNELGGGRMRWEPDES